MTGNNLPNPDEAPRTRPLAQSWSWAFLIWTWVMIVATLVTATPLVLFAVSYARYHQEHPSLPPGDPDIGYGILMMLVILNAPTALGWLIWLVGLTTRRR
jgi:heme/copper-type cytochrome/quinol oxidase subunit 2